MPPFRTANTDVPPERYTDFGGHKTGHAGRDRARNAVYLAPAAAENRTEHDQLKLSGIGSWLQSEEYARTMISPIF